MTSTSRPSRRPTRCCVKSCVSAVRRRRTRMRLTAQLRRQMCRRCTESRRRCAKRSSCASAVSPRTRAMLIPEIVQRRWVAMERQVRAAVERFGGSVDRVSQGEVLAVFGLASLAGNEADRALRAARQLTTAPPHEVSIAGCALACGIAAGQVLPASLEAPFPLTGRAVWRRARTRSPRRTQLDTGRHGSCGPAGNKVWFRTSGRAGRDGLTAHKVVACIDSESMPTARPFVGRRAELALLTTLLEQVRRSGRARTIAVRGEAGIGKSSLIQALVRTASDLGVAVHILNVLDFGQSAADRPIPALALYLLGGEAEASSSDRAAAVERAVNSGLIAHEDRAIACDLVGAALSEEAAARLAAMDNATRDRGRSRMLLRLLEHAADSPLLLVVEDVHWAAANEIAQLAEVAASAAALPGPRGPDVPDHGRHCSPLHGGPGAGAARSRRSTLRRSRRTRRANLLRRTRALPSTSSNAASAPRSVIRFSSSNCCVRPGSGR